MTVTRRELLERRLAFHRLTRELGLAPPPTSPAAQSWNPKPMDQKKSPIVAALAKDGNDLDISKVIVAPSTIQASTQETTGASIVVNFIETAETVQQLASAISQYTENDPEKARTIAVIVGKCIEDHAGAKVATAKFSDLLTEKMLAIVGSGANNEKRSYTQGVHKYTYAKKKARSAVTSTAIECDKLKVNDPTKNMSEGNWSNCAVHTVFVHSATQHEGLGGPDTSLFINYMPNHVVSRAVPILNVTIDLPDGIEKRKLIQSLGPSLILGSKIGLKENPGVDAAFTKTIEGSPDDPNMPRRSIGNDTFNSPQTLSPSRARISTHLNELDPLPIDQFAPLAAIESFSFNFDGTSQNELLQREAAKGELVLTFPDKTKLTGLDQLLVGTNGLLTLTFEFGWSVMPDQLRKQSDGSQQWMGSQDPVMTYMNQQRIRIGAATTLNNIDFSDSGAVKVTLGLLDPANEDKVDGPGIADVHHFMKVYNKSDTRFINFVMKVLQSKESAFDDIASKTGYRRTISKVISPAKKAKLSRKQKKQVARYEKSKKMLHYSMDHLSQIKKGEAFKDGDLILDQINTVESTNMDEIKGYEYLYIDMSKGGTYVDEVKHLIEKVYLGLSKKKVKGKYARGTTKNVAILEKFVTQKVVYIKPPAGRDIPIFQNFPRIRVIHKKVKDSHAKVTKRFKTMSDLSISISIGPKNLARGQIGDIFGGNEVWLKSKKIEEGPISIPAFEQSGEPRSDEPPAMHIGKVKLAYPRTLQPPMTAAQQKKKNVNQNAADKSSPKNLDVIPEAELKQARNDLMIYMTHHILSNGFVLNRSSKPGAGGKRIMSGEDGTDASEKALSLEPKEDKNMPSGSIMKWWYETSAAMLFVPLSHLVHFSLVQSLYASGKYDEIQVVYFKFNESSGRMSGRSIGDVPVKVEKTINYWMRATSPFAFINQILNREINTSTSSTPYGFETEKKKTKKGKKEVKVLKPNQTVPKVIMMMRNLLGKDPQNPKSNRRILRVSFMDVHSSADEGAGQRIMNSMRDDGRTTAVSNHVTTNMSTTEAIRKKMFHKALQEANVIEPQKPNDVLGEKSINVGPHTFRAIKAAIKSVHPHINYGAMGSAVLRGSLSGQFSGAEKMDQWMAAQKVKTTTSNKGRHTAVMAGKPSKIGLTEVIGAARSVDLEMVGCPLLQCGSMYFIDFYTGTDIDNFYVCKKVQHKIDGNKYSTIGTFHLWDGAGRVTIPGDTEGFEKMMSEEADPSET